MSMISELIEELIDNADLYTKELHDLMYRAADTIEMLSEKAREPKQGEWVGVTNGRGGHECSNCHAYAPSYMNGDEHLSDFCPNCGCRMKGADRKTEPQTYVINPQEPTNDDKCFECDDFFTCGGQCNKIEDEPQTETQTETKNSNSAFEKTDCQWK